MALSRHQLLTALFQRRVESKVAAVELETEVGDGMSFRSIRRAWWPQTVKRSEKLWEALPYSFANTKFIWLDLVERTVVAVVFGFFAVRMYSSFKVTHSIAVPLLLISEILPVFLIVFRKWSQSHAMSTNPLDWFLALVGANAPLLSLPGSIPGAILPEILCSLVIVAGFVIQISAKIILWRSFGVVPAAREIKVHGPYRFVRHPMYAGYIIAHIGFLLAFPIFWNLTVYSAALAIQIARISREEKILSGSPLYREFSSRVRYRLLPGVF
jgi:protein-S-isoprenylcysteine O-methyltransferase Ste14